MRRYQDVLIAFVTSRFIIALLMGFSSMIVVPGENGPRGGFIGILTQGDAARYLQIATSGYGSGADALANIGLFPLYPLLVGAVSLVLRDAAISAILISNFALLAAGILLKELLDRQYGERSISRSAVTFLMFSPLSFFFSGAHAESTLLMCTLGALLAAASGRWRIAAAAGACASAVSALGVIVLLPLALEYFAARRGRYRQSATISDGILLFALVPFGGALHLCWSWFQYGDPLAPLAASEWFRAGLVTPWESIGMLSLIPPFYRAFTLLMLGSAVALWCAAVLLKVRASHLIYAAALIAIYACSPALPSIGRWLCIVFPLYIALAVLTKRLESAFEPLLACSLTLLAFCTILVANGHWMR